jgi:hypothetical protein
MILHGFGRANMWNMKALYRPLVLKAIITDVAPTIAL